MYLFQSWQTEGWKMLWQENVLSSRNMEPKFLTSVIPKNNINEQAAGFIQ